MALRLLGEVINERWKLRPPDRKESLTMQGGGLDLVGCAHDFSMRRCDHKSVFSLIDSNIRSLDGRGRALEGTPRRSAPSRPVA